MGAPQRNRHAGPLDYVFLKARYPGQEIREIMSASKRGKDTAQQ